MFCFVPGFKSNICYELWNHLLPAWPWGGRCRPQTWSVTGCTTESRPSWGWHPQAYAPQFPRLTLPFPHQTAYFLIEIGTSKFSQRVVSFFKKLSFVWISVSKLSNPGLHLKLTSVTNTFETLSVTILGHLSFCVYKTKKLSPVAIESPWHCNTSKFCNFKPAQTHWTQVPSHLWYIK